MSDINLPAARIGSLFSGYGGLDLAIHDVIPNSKTAWVSDVCKVDKAGTAGHHNPHRAPCSILAHRFPQAPNLGDITQIKWTPDCPATPAISEPKPTVGVTTPLPSSDGNTPSDAPHPTPPNPTRKPAAHASRRASRSG